MRKVATLVLILILFTFIIGAHALPEIPSPTEGFYVNDFANVLTEETERLLMTNARRIASQYNGMQIVVTTVTSLEGDSLENYAFRMYNEYKIGENSMGILLLFSLNDRKMKVQTGTEMRKYLKDDVAQELIEKAKENLPKEKINERIIKLQELAINEAINRAYPPTPTPFVEAIPAVVATETPVSKSDSPIIEPVYQNKEDSSTLYLIILLGAVILLLLFSFFSLKDKSKKLSDLNVLLKKKEQEYLAELSSIEQRHFRKTTELEGKFNLLQTQFDTLQDRYKRACTLFPTVDLEVTQMLKEESVKRDKSSAKNVDDVLIGLLNLTPNREYTSRIKQALDQYSSLTEPQKEYVTADISKLRKLYSTCHDLQIEYEKEQKKLEYQREAKRVSEHISSVTSSIHHPDRWDLYKLQQAKGRYDSLTYGAREYFDPSVLILLNSMLNTAQSDQSRYDQDQAQSSYDTSSFGGFGGSSDPGSGASGDF